MRCEQRPAWLDKRPAESYDPIQHEMSTAELKQMIDARTMEERKWIAAYLLDQMFAVPELRQTAEELAELQRRRGELLAGRERVPKLEELYSRRLAVAGWLLWAAAMVSGAFALLAEWRMLVLVAIVLLSGLVCFLINVIAIASHWVSGYRRTPNRPAVDGKPA